MLKAIEKDPEARYPTAEAMAEDLRRFLADEPIQARQVGAAERYWRWARRNPVIAGLGGAVLTRCPHKYCRRVSGRWQWRRTPQQLALCEADLATRKAIEERDTSTPGA